MNITVTIPAILADALGVRELAIEAGTVRKAVAAIRKHPKLGPLIFDESAALRRHVILFLNDTAIQHLDSLDQPLTATDRIAVVQAVSGG